MLAELRKHTLTGLQGGPAQLQACISCSYRNEHRLLDDDGTPTLDADVQAHCTISGGKEGGLGGSAEVAICLLRK